MPAIECEGLGHRYGRVLALDGLHLAVEPGEVFAFLGPNGAGKSTTLHILTTLLAPSAGRARVLGWDVRQEAQEIRARTGVVFQEPALDDRLTAAENLEIHAALYRVSRREARRRIQEALEWAALAGAARQLVGAFSGGMKRRLELARALMHDPQVLFLDEPTAGLDPQGRRHLWERIDSLRERGLTVFLTSHYLHEVEVCDRVGIIDHGHMIAAGRPEEVKERVLGTREATLEEVFLHLTGRQLRDDAATPRDRLLGFARRGGEQTR